MPIPDTTIRDGRERPTPASPLARARLVPSAFPCERKTGLRSHRHHQHHTPCVAGQLERHETRLLRGFCDRWRWVPGRMRFGRGGCWRVMW